MTARAVQIGDVIRLTSGVTHRITTDGELGFANWLIENGRAVVVTDESESER